LQRNRVRVEIALYFICVRVVYESVAELKNIGGPSIWFGLTAQGMNAIFLICPLAGVPYPQITPPSPPRWAE